MTKPSKSSTNLAALALKSAQVDLGEASDTTSYQVDVKNRICVRHSIVRCRFDKPPNTAKKYLWFRPRLVRKTLAEIGNQSQSNTEAFLKQYAPDYLSGAIANGACHHDSAPLAYQHRIEKVVDRVETQVCSRCSGKGSFLQTRSESTRTPCLLCGGMGGRFVTEYLYKPGTTAHGAPVQKYIPCSSCGGSGNMSGPMRTWTEKVTCARCAGAGVSEKKFYRKQNVFLADSIRSHFERAAAFKWPQEIRRLIVHGLVQEDDLFAFCEKSGETRRVNGSEVIIDVKVNLAIQRHNVEMNGATSTVSVLNLPSGRVMIANTPILDWYLKRQRRELRRLSWKQVVARADRDAFLLAMIRDAMKRRKPKTLVPALGFMASRRQIGALLRLLRRVERRRRTIAWMLALSLGGFAGYALIFHFDKVAVIFRSMFGP